VLFDKIAEPFVITVAANLFFADHTLAGDRFLKKHAAMGHFGPSVTNRFGFSIRSFNSMAIFLLRCLGESIFQTAEIIPPATSAFWPGFVGTGKFVCVFSTSCKFVHVFFFHVS